MQPKPPFTVDDFEKGLMLLGYILPSTERELEEKDAVEQYEKLQAEEKKQTYFRRVVLAAEIAAQLCHEPTLGRVKFQKVVYLCEYAAEMHVGHRYQKQAAGPFDNKFMHSIADELKKQGWFDTKEVLSNGRKRTIYVPLAGSNGYKDYYNRYFSQLDDSIQHIIQLFRKQDTANTELAATVYACVLELLANQQQVTKQALTTLFYEWSEAKRRFSEIAVLNSAYWLKQNGLITTEIIDL